MVPSGGINQCKEDRTLPEAQRALGCDGVLRRGAVSQSAAPGEGPWVLLNYCAGEEPPYKLHLSGAGIVGPWWQAQGLGCMEDSLRQRNSFCII